MSSSNHHPHEHPGAHSLWSRVLASPSAGGIVLMIVALLALLCANSPLANLYHSFFKTDMGGLSILHWINDGLMAVFFLMVGLEIKREVLVGQLSSWPRRVLPSAAALGGIVGPALVYVSFNLGEDGNLRGWAIPVATDIAFALAVLSLLGPRVPVSLKIFLAALAIIDDLCAVIIIALFYTSSINLVALLISLVIIALLTLLNRQGVLRLQPYLLLGLILWIFVLKSGVHATLAGVVLALTIPLHTENQISHKDEGPLHALEHAISPWVAFLIVPIFGFANAGVSFAGYSIESFLNPVSVGIALGLFAGKQIGIFLFSFCVIKMHWAELPPQATWRDLYGISLLCGIGFTMSLFIGILAFPEMVSLQNHVKVGVMIGSLFSGILGFFILRMRPSQKT